MQIHRFVLLFMALFLFHDAKANHILGGDLTYSHISGLTYKVTLSLYGQCGSQGNAFDKLPTAQPVITLFNGNTNVASIILDCDTSLIAEITPVCNALKNATKCSDINSTIPGVKKFIYNKIYTLPTTSTNWIFVFDGNLGATQAGRAGMIDNVVNPAGQIMYLISELNNQSFGPNSSAQFTTIPTPFFCANTEQEYNQGAIDADNDSLSFMLTPALINGDTVTYNPGFSSVFPLHTANGSFYFNPLNGQMSFIPDMQQNALVVNKVNEYRNGVFVGSVMREMTFVILSGCNNNPARDTVIQTTNCTVSPGNFINLCEGTSSINFNTHFSDPDGDSIHVSCFGLPSGAILNITNNDSPAPSFSLAWITAGVPIGIYNFYVTTIESNCPINNKRTQSFSIRVARKNTITYNQLSGTNCAFKAVVNFNMEYGILPRTVTVTNGAGFTKVYLDSTGSIVDSFPSGNYWVKVTSPYLPCLSDSVQFHIIDDGVYPYTPVLSQAPNYCIGDPAVQLQAIPNAGATVHWFNINGSPLSTAPFVNTSFANVVYYLISQQKGTCVSKLDTVKVVVSDFPVITVTNKTGSACLGDKILLQATGAVSYTWLPADQILYNDNNEPYIRVMMPSAFQVIGVNQYGCKDTVDFNYTDILPCCLFSYPTAFSPNHDAHNDTWRPIMYGNEETYDLIIVNRFGQVIFHSKASNESWDGTFNGNEQDMGTYFYYLKAKCLTGQEEEHKGDFLLLR